MKHTIKLFGNVTRTLGIIAIVAVIGFSMSACGGDDGGGGDGNNSTKQPELYVTQDGLKFFYNNTTNAIHNDINHYYYEVAEVIDETKTSFTIPDSITSNTVTVPVESIGWEVFLNRTTINSISIPSSIKKIENGAFWGCKGISSITIPNSVELIAGYAFSGCTGITSITIPSSVILMGGNVFGGWTASQTINVPFATWAEMITAWDDDWLINCQAVIKNNADQIITYTP